MSGTASPNSGGQVRTNRVREDDAGQRVDNYLMRLLQGVPRGRIYSMLRRGEVRINGGRAKPHRRLVVGDQVRIPPVRVADTAPSESASKRARSQVEASIFHEDDHILVLDKPAGMAVHGGSGIDLGLIEVLRACRPDVARLELVHRLDRDTSGVILVAKRRSALVALHAQLRAAAMSKHYLALVAGHWPASLREVELPLEVSERYGRERIVRVKAGGKVSRTQFSVVQRYERTTLVRAEPVTGRTHQIRVHAAHCGHPILGDPKYATAPPPVELKRMFLHACSLGFHHPASQQWVQFEVPLPSALTGVLEVQAGAASGPGKS